MVLILDNYDSFVFNLARYVKELGFDYEVYRNDRITLEEIDALAPSHIILSPGPCTPLEAGISLELVTTFLAKIPILGVCLGHQAIAAACGGRVVRAQLPQHGKVNAVDHNGEGLFQGLPNPLQVGCYHSLTVEEATLPSCLRVTAYNPRKGVMALQHIQYPVFGVQFHPESILTPEGHTLLARFLSVSASTQRA